MKTVFDVEIKCGRCVYKEMKKVEFPERQHVIEIDWQCPNCSAMGLDYRRIIVVTKQEEEEKRKEDIKTVERQETKKYKQVDGQTYEVDDSGKKIKKPRKIFRTDKKKEKKLPKPNAGVVLMED